MRDENFLSVFKEINTALGSLKGLTYAYDPNITDQNALQWKNNGVQVIKETAIGFMYELTKRLRKKTSYQLKKFWTFFPLRANE